ncbi:MAG TPA: CBS domain-containing protein [Anaerolineales bacterium]|nr:CBS domain-containing protein [Anaerolineales bacterium]
MKISRYMKQNVISIHASASIREAAAIFVQKHIGLLPVVDNENKPVGIVGLRDLLSLELPDFVNFIADLDFVHDFGAVETTRPSAEVLDRPVKSLIKPAILVEEDTGLLRAYALMLQHDLHDIPVVSRAGKLVGIASRVDIGTAILSAWEQVE